LIVAATRRSAQSLRAASARARREGNGFGHAQVAQIQRARILAAMFDVATEMGVGHVSVAHVVERSGVSRRTFYETFADREDCFLAAFEDALAFASQRVLPVYGAQGKWREQVRAGVVAFLVFLDEEPVIGRLLLRESSSGGPRTRARREQVLAQIADAIDGGRQESAGRVAAPAPLTAEGLVGGALSILDARLSLSGETPVIGLANVLLSMIVLPYLGPAAARRELERPAEPRAGAPGTRSGVLPAGHEQAGEQRPARLLEDPFKGAGMRLTYRTVRVLLAVAEHAGASNRTIGESAGISDPGQISKLLGRLARLGLIENTGLGPGQGAPNAWVLTGIGHQLTKTIRAHTTGSR
jgi:AcrR family transcriptional regulator